MTDRHNERPDVQLLIDRQLFLQLQADSQMTRRFTGQSQPVHVDLSTVAIGSTSSSDVLMSDTGHSSV
jgi:hypothetical protein